MVNKNPADLSAGFFLISVDRHDGVVVFVTQADLFGDGVLDLGYRHLELERDCHVEDGRVRRR